MIAGWQAGDGRHKRLFSAGRFAFTNLNRLVPALALALLLVAPAASGWGAKGHQLVTAHAQSRLTANARAEVERLLALEPGATLNSVSTWADETRSSSTAAWHYVNMPHDANCRYEAARDCVAGKCVVGSIERQAAILASNAPDDARLKALKYLVHLMADVHQPLHAGFADDRGGNQYQVQAYGRGTNMHALWDSALIEHWSGGLPTLQEAMAEQRTAPNLGPAGAAEESCRIVSSPGFYPVRRQIDLEYSQRWNSTLAQQLAAAGDRLAALLNEALGTRR